MKSKKLIHKNNKKSVKKEEVNVYIMVKNEMFFN